MPSFAPIFERGEAGVAAGTDDDIRAGTSFRMRFGLAQTSPDMRCTRHEIVPDGRGRAACAGSWKSSAVSQPEALARDELVLHAVLRADEEDLAVRLPLAEHAGDRDGGIDVPARAAAGKDDCS